MRPGDLVEFKPGSHGIGAPNNVGIYLDRVKRKGDFYLVLWTVKGRVEMKREAVTSRKLSARIDDLDEKTLASRLQALLKDLQKGRVREDQQVKGQLTDRDLWRAVSGTTDAYSPEMLAASYFGQGPGKSQVEAVRKALESCRPGVGYFQRAPRAGAGAPAGEGDRWVPIGVEAYKAAKREVEQLYALRKRLVKEELVEEEGWDEPRTVYRGVPLDRAGLGEEDRARLDLAKRFMAGFVLHDRDTGEVTLAQSGIHTIDGFSVFEFCRWLSADWLGGAVSGISSTFVEFLVESGLWTEHEALLAVARRKVLQHPDFAWDTPEQVEKEAARFTQDSVAHAVQGRWDLRQGHACYTIDPPDAKDFDDAVGVDFHPDGTATLWVHIADVSHYVQRGTLLDEHARRRATSVYLPVKVLPMLPHALSDDLCSLRAERDRLAMTAKLTYSAGGELLREEFGESVIRVAENKHYGQVDEAIGQGREPFARMEAFARVLQGKRRGLALETGERKILFGPDGLVDPTLKGATPATRMIEVFMVAANEAVARHITAQGFALPYRCHPLPDRAGVERFNAQLATMELGLRIALPERSGEEQAEVEGPSLLDTLKSGGKLELLSGGFRMQDEAPDEGPEAGALAPHVKGLAQLGEAEREAWLQPFRDALAKLRQVGSGEVRDLVQLKLLGCMGRAFYTPRNLGHFGLGSTCYSHFTSPIRRYPDLATHRMLRWLLRGNGGEAPHPSEDLEELSVHCSDQGSASEELERGVVDVAMVFATRSAAMEGTLRGLVTGITKGSVYLSFPGGLEGRLLVSDVPGGPYAVDEHDSMLYQGEVERPVPEEELEGLGWRELVAPDGEVKRVRLRLGDWLSVVLTGRDYVDGRVRVKLVGHLERRRAAL
jgi:ribonuclease R